MQFYCKTCNKPVTNDVPTSVTLRAFVQCPECFKIESSVRINSIHAELNMNLAERLTLAKDALINVKGAFLRAELKGFTQLMHQSPDKGLSESVRELTADIVKCVNHALQELA